VTQTRDLSLFLSSVFYKLKRSGLPVCFAVAIGGVCYPRNL